RGGLRHRGRRGSGAGICSNRARGFSVIVVEPVVVSCARAPPVMLARNTAARAVVPYCLNTMSSLPLRLGDSPARSYLPKPGNLGSKRASPLPVPRSFGARHGIANGTRALVRTLRSMPECNVFLWGFSLGERAGAAVVEGAGFEP